jgi:uncharacterized membrane protein
MDSVYSVLLSIGYTHPLHPVLTHLPVGLIMAALIFKGIAVFPKTSNFDITAYRCLVTALVTAIPAIAIGIADWQYFYGGAWLIPIRVKLGLAVCLVIALAVGAVQGFGKKRPRKASWIMHLVCFALVSVIGFFGGELVYGSKSESSDSAAPLSPLAATGAEVFEQYCAGCHYANKRESKIGPGLGGLSRMKKMPTSGRRVTDTNLRKQLLKPYDKMPPFEHLKKAEVDAVVAYMKTL